MHTGSQLGAEEKGSLFSFINYTRTPFGKRMLRRWLCAPLRDAEAIMQRQEAIICLIESEGEAMGKICDLLGNIKDIEKKTTRAY